MKQFDDPVQQRRCNIYGDMKVLDRVEVCFKPSACQISSNSIWNSLSDGGTEGVEPDNVCKTFWNMQSDDYVHFSKNAH